MGIVVGIAIIGLLIWFFSQPNAGSDAIGCIGVLVALVVGAVVITWGGQWLSSRNLVADLSLSEVAAASSIGPPDEQSARSSRTLYLNGRIDNNSSENSVHSIRLEIPIDYCDLQDNRLVNCTPSDQVLEKYFYTAMGPGESFALATEITVAGVPDGKAVSTSQVSILYACEGSSDLCHD